LGARFAKKNFKDRDIYQAEALYLLTSICKIPEERILHTKTGDVEIDSMQLLIRKVYSGLYKYMFADRVVCASRTTVARNIEEGKHVVETQSMSKDVATGKKGIDVPDKRGTEIEMLELFDEVAKTTHEREYILMKRKGADDTEIAEHLGVCIRIINKLRSRIVKRVRQAMKKQDVDNN
jgi:DNA-binding NarL/FixJ family response regulator